MKIETLQHYIPVNVRAVISGNAVLCEVPSADIKDVTRDLYAGKGLSLKLITATDEREMLGCFNVWYVFGVPKENAFIVPFIRLKNTNEFPSLTPVIHEAWNYERKIRSFFGLIPAGHPDPRQIILHENWPEDIFPLRKDVDWQTRPAASQGTYQFQKVEGEGIYELPVGPIHAGIIEPGHFRFSVAGEEILLLEPRLGFTHKGSEKLFEQLPLEKQVRLSEKISGDSSFSHSLAFCQAVEQLGDREVPRRARYLRVIFAELERLANHTGDLGALMLDAGYNFGGAQGARLREIIMQINGRITGSRFLRGVNVAGGVAHDISAREKDRLSGELPAIAEDFSEIIEIAENSTSLLNRLKGTGVVSSGIAQEHGIVGIAARAAGRARDTRIDFPYAAYDELRPDNIETEQGGDVYARFRVRVKEVRASIDIIQHALHKLPEGPLRVPVDSSAFRKSALALNAVEGWRGEIVYFITTDAQGKIARVAPRDPSFVNWPVLGNAGLGNVVPDFPLINKSFNLSYSGNDL